MPGDGTDVTRAWGESLPDWANTFIEMLTGGQTWPEASESALWQMAEHYGQLQIALEEAAQDAVGSANAIRAGWDAPAAQVFDSINQSLFNGYNGRVVELAQNAYSYSARADAFGTETEYTKLGINIAFWIAIAEAFIAVLSAWWTAGSSLAAIAAIKAGLMAAIRRLMTKLTAVAARKIAVKAATKTAIQAGKVAVKKLATAEGRRAAVKMIGRELVEEVSEEVFIDALAQTIQIRGDTRQNWDFDKTQAAGIGAGTGAMVGLGLGPLTNALPLGRTTRSGINNAISSPAGGFVANGVVYGVWRNPYSMESVLGGFATSFGRPFNMSPFNPDTPGALGASARNAAANGTGLAAATGRIAAPFLPSGPSTGSNNNGTPPADGAPDNAAAPDNGTPPAPGSPQPEGAAATPGATPAAPGTPPAGTPAESTPPASGPAAPPAVPDAPGTPPATSPAESTSAAPGPAAPPAVPDAPGTPAAAPAAPLPAPATTSTSTATPSPGQPGSAAPNMPGQQAQPKTEFTRTPATDPDTEVVAADAPVAPTADSEGGIDPAPVGAQDPSGSEGAGAGVVGPAASSSTLPGQRTGFAHPRRVDNAIDRAMAPFGEALSPAAGSLEATGEPAPSTVAPAGAARASGTAPTARTAGATTRSATSGSATSGSATSGSATSRSAGAGGLSTHSSADQVAALHRPVRQPPPDRADLVVVSGWRRHPVAGLADPPGQLANSRSRCTTWRSTSTDNAIASPAYGCSTTPKPATSLQISICAPSTRFWTGSEPDC